MREYIFMLRKNLFSFEAFRIFNIYREKFNYLILIKYRQDYKYLFRH